MSTLKAVRGTRDLLPPETELWNHVEATARRVFVRYNFGEIRTPIFEDTSLFARGVGEETDIVSKEMYTWEDRGRFDANALKDVWWREVKGENGPNLQAGNPLSDVVLEWGRGKIQLVNFVENATNSEIQRIWSALQSYRLRPGITNEFGIVGTIVFPEGNRSDSVPPEWRALVDCREVRGNFYFSRQSLTLRPENTAGVVRAYIEHKLGETGLLQKLYYIGPQFRRERPQKGRYRQFWQIGAEVIGPPSAGSESPLRDAEVLEMLAMFLDELGIDGWRLEINSVGSAADRARYTAALREALAPVKHKMCEDNQRRAETNPLRVLDSKDENDQEIINGLPKIADYLDGDSKAHFAAVLAALDKCGVSYHINPRLVRGLDYYTRTTFEFTHGGLGAQNALLGGGRYDGLSEALGGPKAPGIGFAIGEDRLILTLQAQKNREFIGCALQVYVVPIGTDMDPNALAMAKVLRASGIKAELGDGKLRPKKNFEIASKLGARYALIIGPDEVRTGEYSLKDLENATQTQYPESVLFDAIKGVFKPGIEQS